MLAGHIDGHKTSLSSMFEAVGVTVSRLMRVRYGPFELPPQLRRGQSMELDERAIRKLMADFGMEEVAVRPSQRKVRTR